MNDKKLRSIKESNVTDNSKRNVEINWVNFKDTKLQTSFLNKIYSFLVWEEKLDIYKEINSKSIYQILWNLFLIEYDKQENQNEDIELFKNNFKASKNFAIPEKDWTQVPNIEAVFSHEWKYYIIVNALLKLNEIENIDRGIFEWIIFEPKKYFGSFDETIKETKDIIDNNLD